VAHTRRATLRILARAVQLRPDAGSWTGALRESVAHGDAVRSDPVLTTEQRALAWRGVLLRHHSVGAWRYLWASLVDEVRTAGGSATRADLHAWISAAVPATTVRSFLADCPATTDAAGDPRPAEQEVIDGRPPLESDLAVLLMGGRRLDELTGRALAGFLGRGSRGRGQFLDPRWVAFRHREHHDRPLAERARAFVDDMLAQSRRVALRKLRVEANGRMTLFTRLHERNGRYFADEPEGSDNVGLRIPQLGFLAEQLGLLVDGPEEMAVTPLGAELLELHS
jgi:hypothetical protein